MPEPLRSPKQSRLTAKARSHPYARPPHIHRSRDGDIERSSSILGTIKSFVTAPLAWLSFGETTVTDDSPHKRRVSGTERGGTPPNAKRARRDSPDSDVVGFLDPPSSIFSKRLSIPPWSVNNREPPAGTAFVDAVTPSTEKPLPSSRGPTVLPRTSMSVDPHDTPQIRRSITRDFSMPPPSPFARSYSRSSLTPQPAGATFGPSPKRRTRESTAPPLLGSPTAAPTFTRPPSTITGHTLFPGASSKERLEVPVSTLFWPNRQSASPARESPTRSMLVRNESSVSSLSTKSTAQRTLSTLESFRTPLHTSRFPSATLPETHRPRKVHVPIPSTLRFDNTPEGKKIKRVPAVIGPYMSGMSGMRKLLARRREELQKEAEEEADTKSGRVDTQSGPGTSDAEDDGNEPQNGKGKDKTIETEAEITSEPGASRGHVNGVPLNAADTQPRERSPTRSKGDTYSSLRAPSNRVNRTHASAPKLQKPRNKFSLDDDEEEQRLTMTVEELKAYQIRTQPHISFSTANRRMSETGMQTDTSPDDASRNRPASPLLPAQPQTFDSLLSRIGPPAQPSSKPLKEGPIEKLTTAESSDRSQVRLAPSSEGNSTPAALPFSLGLSNAPTPPVKPVDALPSFFGSTKPEASHTPTLPIRASTEGGVPSFFANAKVQFTPPKVPSSPLFGGPAHGESENVAEPENVSEAVPALNKEEMKQEQQTPKQLKPSPFGGVSKPSIFGDPSAFASSNVSPAGISETPAPNSPSAINGLASKPADESAQPAKPAFSFGTSAVNGTSDPKPGISIFGAASNPTSSLAPTTPTKPIFPLTTPSSSTVAPSVEKPEAVSTAPPDEAKKPVFSFGAAASSSAETAKSPFTFGASPQVKAPVMEAPKTPFSFGAAPSSPQPVGEKPAFAFGGTSGTRTFPPAASATANTPVAGPTTEVIKPIFGGFTTTGTSAVPGTPKPSEPPADNGDGMEVAADRMEESPTRTTEKKDAPTLQLPQSSPFVNFGSGGASGGGASTGFSFAQVKPGSTGSMFSFTSAKPGSATGFGFGQSTNTSPVSTGFNFGADAPKITGQTASVFGPPVTSAFGGSNSNSTGTSSFSFGQSSTNTNTNPFGQSQQPQENGASAVPGSPSLFPQPASQPQSPSPSFTFSLPAPTSAFGAPKLDAAAPSTSATKPFQFGASSGSQQPQDQTGTPPGNSMFTLGSAAATPRKVKGLPNRRAKRP